MQHRFGYRGVTALLALLACPCAYAFGQGQAGERGQKDPPGAAAVPDEAAVKKMVGDSLLAFNSAIQAKDFTAFHEKLSSQFRKEMSAADLLGAFQPFVDNEVNLEGVAASAPAFDKKPGVNKKGILSAKGSYPTQPMRVLFDLSYANEGGKWLLHGVSVNLKKAGAPAPPGAGPGGGPGTPAAKAVLPPEDELKELARRPLLEFDRAVKKKDFTEFHAKASTPMQRQATPEQLKEAFKGFIEQPGGSEVGKVKNEEPVWAPKPSLGRDNVLTLRGHFPTTPAFVVFEIKHFFEAGRWKLLGIDVKSMDPIEFKQLPKPGDESGRDSGR